ncbi:MAG: hypothetical protein KAJ19_09640, partial [Gammaproteobacteria bacterium]|nr:hypothetical protein [Gammaproteobacteria bacterium]
DKNFKIVGSKIIDLDANEVWSVGGYFNKKTGSFGMYKTPKENKTLYYAVDWLPGMGTLIHRVVFEKNGYWDKKNFPQYCGDSDFILRAKERGINTYVYLESVMWNNTKNTGIIHKGSFLKLIRSLFSIKSHYNVFVSLKFLIVHHVTPWGIINNLSNKYVRYIGGYCKHKILNLFKKRVGV